MLLERGMASVEMRELKRQKSPILKAAVIDSYRDGERSLR